MGCGCKEGKIYQIGMGCCRPVLGPIENYYTKGQIDEMIEDIEVSACCITADEVDEKISAATSGLQETLVAGDNITISGNVISAVGGGGSGITSGEVQTMIDQSVSGKADSSDVITSVGVHTVEWSGGNDAIYLDRTKNGTYQEISILIPDNGIKIKTNKHISIDTDVVALKTDIPDVSDYVTFEDMGEYVGDVYTKEEVNNLFVTKATFNTYIINLQQQINSLVEAISGCCSQTGETEYRWITMTGVNDYTCSGTTKMTKEKQQSSIDGGVTWSDTGQYRTGSTVLEYNSADCGYAPSANYKVRVDYKRGYTVGSGQVECNSSTTLTYDEMKDGITFPTYFTSIEFGSCIDTIGEDCFVNVRDISAVTVPSNITTIESCGFNNCGISSYTLSEGLVTIGKTAFVNNYNLSAITIPSTVTSVGSQAFYNCTGLTTVTINATTPPTASAAFGSGIFNGCSNLTTIYVPSASVNAYKTANGWSLYADKIQAIP